MARRMGKLAPDVLNAVLARRPSLLVMTEQSLSAFDDWVGVGEEKRRRRKRGASGSLKRAVEAAEELYERARDEGESAWRHAKPKHLVGLYARLHLSVYGVLPIELDGPAFDGAVSGARGMLHKEFADDALKMIEFMRWVWERERWRERRRKAEGDGDGFRVGWRLQFCKRNLITDWRVDLVRSAGRGKRRS